MMGPHQPDRREGADLPGRAIDVNSVEWAYRVRIVKKRIAQTFQKRTVLGEFSSRKVVYLTICLAVGHPQGQHHRGTRGTRGG